MEKMKLNPFIDSNTWAQFLSMKLFKKKQIDDTFLSFYSSVFRIRSIQMQVMNGHEGNRLYDQ